MHLRVLGPMYMGVGRAELWGGGSKQLKIPPGGGVGRGCNFSFIHFWGWGEGGSGQPGNPSGYTRVCKPRPIQLS